MSIGEKVSMSRASITIMVLVVLCGAALAYSQGWLNWSKPNSESESNDISTEQRIGEAEMDDTTPITPVLNGTN